MFIPVFLILLLGFVVGLFVGYNHATKQFWDY